MKVSKIIDITLPILLHSVYMKLCCRIYNSWHFTYSMFFVLVQWSKTPDFKLLEGEYVLRDLRFLEYTICNLQKVNMIPLALLCS